MKSCVLVAFLVGACATKADVPDPSSQVTITTGVFGIARHLTGDHEPGPGPSSGTTEPASGRSVRVHALVANAADATDVSAPTEYGRFVVHTPLIGQSDVASDGFYELALAPGTYSVFVSDRDAWFCNSYDAVGSCVAAIADGTIVRFDIDVDYEASY
jgi:hypothetical protein